MEEIDEIPTVGKPNKIPNLLDLEELDRLLDAATEKNIVYSQDSEIFIENSQPPGGLRK